MEIRTTAPQGAYVYSRIPRVAETPMEGSYACDPETFGPFGPFESDSATVAKTPNSKGYYVRFEEEQAVDPIERAIDSIILFIDDVREASETVRRDGITHSIKNLDVKRTFECVSECRNPCADPCVEGFETMQAPADMMLNIQGPSSTSDEEKRDSEEAEPAQATTIKKPEVAVLSKQNSVKDFDAPQGESKEPVATATAKSNLPTYSSADVDEVAEKLGCMVPKDALQLVMDSFILETGEVRPDAEELTIKNGVDRDPIIEVIDTLIMTFDDLQEALMKHELHIILTKILNDLQASLMEKSVDNLGKPRTGYNETIVETENDKSDNTTVSDDTMKTTNAKMIRPGSLQMSPDEYAMALSSAADLLSEATLKTDTSGMSKEELHKQALERIMSERSELEEGFTDYKTEEMILKEIMQDADQAIMDARGCLGEERSHNHHIARAGGSKEQLVILGHSATLTPIPEADEASAGTPSSEMIEQGVMNGTIPEVPLLPAVSTSPAPKQYQKNDASPLFAAPTHVAVATGTLVAASPETTQAVMEEAQTVAPKPFFSMQAQQKMEIEPQEEKDPLIYIIDRLFLFFDDMQERKPCEACVGASVPSDLLDPGDEIVVAKEEVKTEEVDAKATEEVDAKAILVPRLNDFPEDSRGQLMLQEALRLVQEASSRKLDRGDFLARMAAKDRDVFVAHNSRDVMEKLGHLFDDANERSKPSQGADTEKKIITVHGIEMTDTEKNRAIAELVAAAFEDREKGRKTWNAVVQDPSLVSQDTESEKQDTKVEFEIPELMKHNQDPYIAWGGDDSELMASINADRKLSEIEHANIFRDVSKGLSALPEGFSIYKAPAFTEGNSSSAELPEDRSENPAQVPIKLF